MMRDVQERLEPKRKKKKYGGAVPGFRSSGGGAILRALGAGTGEAA
jgi:hypothetical protein